METGSARSLKSGGTCCVQIINNAYLETLKCICSHIDFDQLTIAIDFLFKY